jgi:hypothetical protein
MAPVLALGAEWYFGFSRETQFLAFLLGGNISIMGWLEIRLKTAQVRLAYMEDKLDKLLGNGDGGGDAELELMDW